MSSDPRLLGALTLRLAILLVFSTALMMFVDVPLQGQTSPWGIVSFEFARTPTRALAILLEWKRNAALGHAKLSLIADFLYLIIYGSFFAMLARWVGVRVGEVTWSRRAAAAAVGAAGFDVLENTALLIEVVRFSSPAPYPQLSFAFATLKFALLAASAAYSVVGLGALARRRYRRPL